MQRTSRSRPARALLLGLASLSLLSCRTSPPSSSATAIASLHQVEVATLISGPEQSILVVLRSTDGRWLLPIAVGPAEAQSIALELRKLSPSRPMTHDLAKSLVETLGGRVERVEVNQVLDDTFLATMILRRGHSEFRVDARPSDAMAIALRCNAPIFVADPVFSAAGIPASGDTQPASREDEAPKVKL
jgi:uncharacterized protein